MIRPLRYLILWRTLPDEERRVRAYKVLDRLRRRRPWVRRLLAAEQPSWRSFEREIEGGLEQLTLALRPADERRGPLHVDLSARAQRVAARHPELADGLLERARLLLEREFDLLGSGPIRPLREDGGIAWHLDWKVGTGWPEAAYYTDVHQVRGDGSDVKVPWELSRFQHLLVLGQAFRLAPLRLDPEAAGALRSRLAAEAVAQIDDWIRHNPPAVGIGWCCTMDVAIRAANWTAALALFRGAEELNGEFLRVWLRSLWQHGRFIRANLEFGGDGLTSNHYLSDIVGLYAIGCALPELSEAAGWRARARQALIEEIERQIHPDGVDFERSISYHRLVTELFLHGALLARCSGAPLPGRYHRRLMQMLEFVVAYTRPDGRAPQWGDNDDGRYLPLGDYASHEPNDHRHLLALGGRLLDRPELLAASGPRNVEALWLFDGAGDASAAPVAPAETAAFPDVGCYVVRRQDCHTCIYTGAVGTAGVGNHTHNDVGSFSLWVDGRDWVIDPGSGSYTADPELRNRLRGTGAHATLQLGEREQNELPPGLDGLFLVRERAHPEVEIWDTDDRQVTRLRVLHRGFSRGRQHWVHRREFTVDSRIRRWRIEDTLELDPVEEGPLEREPVHLRFPLAPGTVLDLRDDAGDMPAELIDSSEPFDEPRLRRTLRLSSRDGGTMWVALDLPAGSRVEAQTAPYSIRYGVSCPAPVLVATLPLSTRVRTVSVLHAPRPERTA